jgi:hypothetical protein
MFTITNEPIISVFDVAEMNTGLHDKVLAQLEAAGEMEPNGRLYHMASRHKGGWLLTEVWQSSVAFSKYKQTFVPILQQNGIKPPDPQIYPATPPSIKK